MAPQLKQMDATLQVILQHMKNASAIEVARVNKGDDDGVRALEAEMSAAAAVYGHAAGATADIHGATVGAHADRHAAVVDAATRLRTAAMDNMTQAHNTRQTLAAQPPNPNPGA
jgi:hypothetical protein